MTAKRASRKAKCDGPLFPLPGGLDRMEDAGGPYGRWPIEADGGGSDSAGRGYLMPMVTVLEVTPPIAMDKGTALPEGAVAGTCAFTWYTPT